MVEKGLKLPEEIKLNNSEKEVLHLLSDEFLTIKQIAQRRECSIQYVYRVLKSLKKKGSIDSSFNRFKKELPTFNQTDIRLHGQEINIRIISQRKKYQELLNKSNTMFLDGNTIRLYKNSIEVYSGQSFYGKTIEESEKNSLEYLTRFLIRLEHDLEVCLVKNRSRNIKIVNQHYARGDSEICDNSVKNRERVWVYAEEDGKLAFITDDSFGFREDETVHPITAKQDRKAVDKQVNDWRLNNPLTNSELQELVQGVVSNQVIFDKNMKSHIEAIKGLSSGVRKLNKTMGGIIKENRRLRLGSQEDLNKWI